MFVYGKRSLQHLEGVHPDLVAVFEKALSYNIVDIAIIDGVRAEAEHAANLAKGVTRIPFSKSRHRIQNDGYGHAIDAIPYPLPEKWGEKPIHRAEFYFLAGVIRAAAAELGVKIRGGYDWDNDNKFDDQSFNDLVHFELVVS